MSSHWIGSPKSVTGRGWMKRRPAHAKIIAVLLETLMAILHSLKDRGSTKQMEDICRQQSRHHPRRNSFSHMKTCAISVQSCWSTIKRNCSYSTFNIHTVVERSTMTFTGVFQLACNRGQHSYRKFGNQKCTCCTSTISRRHHPKIFQVKQTNQVIAYCRSFINNSRHPKANRQTTALSTQDFDQALNCCVKMVQ